MWIILITVVMMAIGFPPTANLGPTWVTTVVGASFSEFGLIALGWGGGAFLASALMTRYAAYDRMGLLLSAGALLFAASFIVLLHRHQLALRRRGEHRSGRGAGDVPGRVDRADRPP